MSPRDIFENIVFPKGGPNKISLVEREGYSVMRIALGKGARIPPHIASHSAFFFIVKGSAIITSGDEQIELRENEYIALETNQMRGIQALEDLVVLGVRD
ncbi:MAG: hypothetical protein ACFFEF_14930 [Candidatus Thorarchaeota archaeon]